LTSRKLGKAENAKSFLLLRLALGRGALFLENAAYTLGRLFPYFVTNAANYIFGFGDNWDNKTIRCGIKEMHSNHTNIQKAYVGLGSNLGNRQDNLRSALSRLAALPTITVTRVSSLYETAPVGVTNQPNFVNAVAALETALPAVDLLDILLHLENQLGRVRTFRWGPRVIDMDLLLYGDKQIDLPSLTVPHPRLRERAFVLVPLAEIAPELVLPGDTKPVKELAIYFCGNGNIQRLSVV
jgi:2-amino-4-hydroxy-6-hydroxymethyldihydropteridine diphosphokinase